MGKARVSSIRGATTWSVALVVPLLGLLAVAAQSAAHASAVAPTPVSSPATEVASPRLGDLVTYGYDNARSDDDPADPKIVGLSAAASWNDGTLDGAVYGQPLIFGGRVYVATENDSVYSIAAKTGAVDWSAHVGTAPNLSIVDSAPTLRTGCGDVDPLGITGTPVIDPVRRELFVVEETMLPGPTGWPQIRHLLVAISLTRHRTLWQRDVDPPGGNTGTSFYIAAEQQRPALTLDDGRVYVSFGGLYGDCGQYRGFVTDVAEAGNGPVGSYAVSAAREGAIWGTGGLFVAPGGELFLATGNGSSNNVRAYDEGNSVVELSPALRPLGYWAPANWEQLNAADWDLGSAGPIQVPGTSLLFVAGKPATNGSFGYVMSERRLDGVGGRAFTGPVCTSGGVFGADAAMTLGSGRSARHLVFAPCGGGTVALAVTTSPPRFSRLWVASAGSPDGPPVIAGGLVWALNWHTGALDAMVPATGVVTIARTTAPLPHFATPGIGDGMLVVPTLTGVEAFAVGR